MASLTIKRSIAVIAIVTEKFKEELIAELREAADTTQRKIDQMEFQARRYLADVQKTDHNRALPGRQQIEAEKQKHEALKKEFLGKITEIDGLELGTEYPRGTLEGVVDLQEGDNLEDKLGKAELVIKDGIITEVRGAD